jgi:methyl-accepting chemotaxis protein/methyl-accepting chemotaxis protein-1 (serine sensor receptor)
VASSATDVGTHVDAANEMLAHMAASMGAIERSSGKVTGIVKAIDEIAFQTNILALNAAVEAARAGAAGMGFAVVADEVRSLAQRAASAAHDATALVEESVTSARDGRVRLESFSGEMSRVTAGMSVVRHAAAEVRSGSDQQRQGIEQVSRAISEMEQVIQRTTAMAEETAAASEELQAQADTSRSAVAGIAAAVCSTAGAAAERQHAASTIRTGRWSPADAQRKRRERQAA